MTSLFVNSQRDDLLKILEAAMPTPLWPAIVNGLEEVARQADLYGYPSEQVERAVEALYTSIVLATAFG